MLLLFCFVVVAFVLQDCFNELPDFVASSVGDTVSVVDDGIGFLVVGAMGLDFNVVLVLILALVLVLRVLALVFVLVLLVRVLVFFCCCCSFCFCCSCF